MPYTWLYGAGKGDLSDDLLKPEVIPTDGWNGKVVAGSEEGEESATDII